MSIPRICKVKDPLFASRNKSRSSFRRATRADGPKPLEIALEAVAASRLTFVEDFTLEHSLPSLQIASFEMAGSF